MIAITMRHQYPWYRRWLGQVLMWALSEDFAELRQHDDQLFGYLAELTGNSRFDKDQERLRQSHEDWKKECELTREVNKQILAAMLAQTEAMQQIANRVDARL